jgi:hypothetical protein
MATISFIVKPEVREAIKVGKGVIKRNSKVSTIAR